MFLSSQSPENYTFSDISNTMQSNVRKTIKNKIKIFDFLYHLCQIIGLETKRTLPTNCIGRIL
jgi:hypothetical protein